MFPFPFSFLSGAAPDVPVDRIANAKAMSFNGTDAYIKTSNSTAYSSYSISCWINADTFSNFTRLVSLDSTNHRFLGLHGDGTLISGYKTGGWSELFTTSTITIGSWNHIVLVDDGTNTKIYVNKVENILSNSIAVDGPNYYIGSYEGTGNFFNGSIDEVAIFNTALSAEKITQIYDATAVVGGVPQTANLFTGGLDSSLVYWNRMGDS